MGEGEGRAGRPRPRPPRPLSRDEERAAPRPRDVERSRDDKARSSRAGGGTRGGIRLLGAQDPLSVSRRLGQVLSQGSSPDCTISELSGPSPPSISRHSHPHTRPSQIPSARLRPSRSPTKLSPKKTFVTSQHTPFTGHSSEVSQFLGNPPQFSTTHSNKSQQTLLRSPPAGPRQLYRQDSPLSSVPMSRPNLRKAASSPARLSTDPAHCLQLSEPS